MICNLYLNGPPVLKISEETFFHVVASIADCFYFCPCFYYLFKNKHLNIDACIFLQGKEAYCSCLKCLQKKKKEQIIQRKS